MNRILERIREARTFDDIYPMLVELLDEMRRRLGAGGASLYVLLEFIKYTTDVRALLAEFRQAQSGRKDKTNYDAAIERLNDCYLDLEGMLKELRNDRVLATDRTRIAD